MDLSPPAFYRAPLYRVCNKIYWEYLQCIYRYISISRIFFTRIKIIYIYITYGYIYVHIYAAYSRTVFQKFIQTIDDRLVYKNYHKYIYTDWNFPKYKNIRKFQMVFTFLELSQKKPFSYKKVVYRTRAVNN